MAAGPEAEAMEVVLMEAAALAAATATVAWAMEAVAMVVATAVAVVLVADLWGCVGLRMVVAELVVVARATVV